MTACVYCHTTMTAGAGYAVDGGRAHGSCLIEHDRAERQPDRIDLHLAADNAAVRTLADGGGTFTVKTLAAVTPTEGYAVGGILPAITLDAAALRILALSNTILRMRDALAARGDAIYVGTWYDTGRAYVDAVIILPDLASAGILARTLGERAIYAFETGETIPAESAR